MPYSQSFPDLSTFPEAVSRQASATRLHEASDTIFREARTEKLGAISMHAIGKTVLIGRMASG